MNLKQSLHSLLADNETAEVITHLRSITEGSSMDLNAEVEQISTRFQENIEESHHELSDEGTINRENASIRYALFSVINKLPEDAILPEAQHAKRLKIALFMIAAVVIFAIFAFNLQWFRMETPDSVATPPTTPPPVTPNIETPVIASSQTPVAPVTTPATPAVPTNAPKIVANTLPRLDTLPKKKIKRIKPTPNVIIGDTFRIN